MDLIRAHLSQKSISLAATVAGLLKKWIISLSFSLGEQWAISSFPSQIELSILGKVSLPDGLLVPGAVPGEISALINPESSAERVARPTLRSYY